MKFSLRIPKATAKRLPLYYKSLSRLREEGKTTVSSKELSSMLGIDAAMIRKDLSRFGELGKRGVGYNIELLYRALGRALNIEQHWEMVLAGTGKMASALVEYNCLYGRNFRIMGVFASEPVPQAKVEHLPVGSLSAMSKFIKDHNIKIGIIASTVADAQMIAEEMAKSGILAILNFTPADLYVPDNVKLLNDILTMEMQMLACCLNGGEK